MVCKGFAARLSTLIASCSNDEAMKSVRKIACQHLILIHGTTFEHLLLILITLKQKPNTSPDRHDLFAAFFRQGKINCVIILDEQGHILQANDAFKTTFGYADEDIIGKHFRMLFT